MLLKASLTPSKLNIDTFQTWSHMVWNKFWLLKCTILMFFFIAMVNKQLNKYINSLAPGRFKWNFGYIIFKLALVTDGWVISCEIPVSWMSLNLPDNKSTLVQVMAWCCQATSHYLSQCWPRSMSPNGITRPQWFNQWNQTLWYESLLKWIPEYHLPTDLTSMA